MARYESIAKLGYYPLYYKVVEQAASYIKLPTSGIFTLLDPCMGGVDKDGHNALKVMTDFLKARVGKELQVLQYGIELSQERFTQAVKLHLGDSIKGRGRFLMGATEFAQITPESFSLIYLNPPFDGNGKEQDRWVSRVYDWLMPNGLLVYITTEQAAGRYGGSQNFDAKWELLNVLFPDEQYAPYHEVVIFARRRAEIKCFNLNATLYSKTRERNPLELKPAPIYDTFAVEKTPAKFTMGLPQIDKAFKAMLSAGISHSEVWSQTVTPVSFSQRQQPPEHLRPGHTASMISAGMLDCLPIEDPDLGRCIISGYGLKEADQPEIEHGGKAGEQKIVIRETPVIKINVMNIDNGHTQTFTTKDPEVMTTFLNRHLETFRQAIERDFPPQFETEDILGKYFDAMSYLGAPKVLPAVTTVRLNTGERAVVHKIDKKGNIEEVKLGDGTVRAVFKDDIDITHSLMLPKQFIKAATVAEMLRRGHKYAAIVATMGSGKTVQSISAYILYLQNRLDALLSGRDQEVIIAIMPGHLIHNWVREAKAITSKLAELYNTEIPIYIPGKVDRVARDYVIRDHRMCCPACGKATSYKGDTQEQVESKVNQSIVKCSGCKHTLMVHYTSMYADIDDAFKTNGLKILVMSKEDMKLGAGWRMAGIPKFQYKKAPLTGTIEETHAYTCPKCGEPITESVDDDKIIVDATNFLIGKTKLPHRCTTNILAKVRDEEGHVEMKVVEINRLMPVGSELVQEVDPKTGEPLWNEDGTPVMVEYRPGSKYLSNRLMEFQTVVKTIQYPAMQRGLCDEPMWTETRNSDKFKWGEKKHTIGKNVYQTHHAELWMQSCENRSGARKEVGKYIAERYARRYLLIADELHSFKAQDSHDGNVFAKLANNAKKTIGLTGTIYNGKASGLFFLLHRLSPAFRRVFRYNEVTRFVNAYGVVDTIVTRKRADQKQIKGYGGRQYESRRTVEANGCMPSIVQWLLPFTVFMDLNDLNIQLPPIHTKFHWVPVDGKLQASMDALQTIRDIAVKEAQRGDMARLSAWIQAALGWILSPDQDETWMHPDGRKIVEETEEAIDKAYTEGNIELATTLKNKLEVFIQNHTETWLKAVEFTDHWPAPEIVQAVARQVYTDTELGDKSLIYVSGVKRPAAKSVYQTLKKLGVRCFVLSTEGDDGISEWCDPQDFSQCELEEREPVITNLLETREIDALICNPQLVATGLNLVQFNDVHFVGTTHRSSLIIGQAMKRVHRPGQTKDVTVHTWAYGDDPRQNPTVLNHVQALAAMAMAQKLRAAAIVTGDVGDAMAAISERQGDILKVVRDQILKGELPEFDTANEATAYIETKIDQAMVDLQALMERYDAARIRNEERPEVTPDLLKRILYPVVEAEEVGEPVLALPEPEVEQPEPEPVAMPEPVDPWVKIMAEDAAYDYIPAQIAASIPKLYKTSDTKPYGKTVYVKLFTPDSSWTWYVCEYDGQDECFGLVDGLEREWGYFTLSDLRQQRGPTGLPIERDIRFTPTTIGNILGVEEQEPVVEAATEPEPAPAPTADEELAQAIVQATAEIKTAAAEDEQAVDFVVYEEPEEVLFVWPTQAGIVWKVDEVMLAREERMTVLEFLAA